MNEIHIDDSKKLIIKSLSIKYDDNNQKIERYSIQGYLLEK